MRTTPLNMVCRDPDRELMLSKGTKLNLAMSNISNMNYSRMPLGENQSQRPDTSSMNHLSTANNDLNLSPKAQNIDENQATDNMITDEIGILFFD